METAQPMPQPPDHPLPATRCPQCLRETMVAAPGGGMRCANCKREWPPRVFGCLVALLVCVGWTALLWWLPRPEPAPTARSLALADQLAAIAAETPSGDGLRHSLLHLAEALRARRSHTVTVRSGLRLTYDAASDVVTVVADEAHHLTARGVAYRVESPVVRAAALEARAISPRHETLLLRALDTDGSLAIEPAEEIETPYLLDRVRRLPELQEGGAQ